MKDKWMITIANGALDNILYEPFEGTEEEVKTRLLALVQEDRANDSEGWSYGTEAVIEIGLKMDYHLGLDRSYAKLCAYGNYGEYVIEYVAIKLADMFPEAVSMQTPAGELICIKSGAEGDYPGLQISLRKDRAESTVAVVEYSDGNMVTSAYAWEGDEPVQTIKW